MNIQSAWEEFEAAVATHVPFIIGLKNMGNTCFFNSILNSLYSIKPLVPTLGNHNLTDIYGTDPKMTILRLFTNLMFVNFKNQSEESESRTRMFLKKLYEQQYQKGQQQDSHEFMMRLLTWLSGCLEHAQIKVKLQTNSLEAGESVEAALDLINNLYISLKQTTKCENGHVNESIIEKEILSVDIYKKNDINECIASFFSTEVLPSCLCSNNRINQMCNAFNCDKCGKHTKANKCFTITKLPEYLIINLKIFSPNKNQQVTKFLSLT
jgi:ubiquitin C-terminal hydrolase